MSVTAINYGSSGVDVSGTWNSDANAYDASTITFATTTSVNGLHTFEVGGYNESLPPGSTIDDVQVQVWHYCGNTSRWDAPTVQAYDGSTPLGSAVTLTESTTTTNSQIVSLGTPSQVLNSTFKVRFSHNRTSTTGSTVSNLAAIGLTITYTPPAGSAIKTWNGSSWVDSKFWNGTAWVDGKVWNGTAWV